MLRYLYLEIMKVVTGIILRFLGNWSLMQIHVTEIFLQFRNLIINLMKFDEILLQFDSFMIHFLKTQSYVT